MAKNGDTRKLLLDIDIETMEYINDYKYAMLLSQGIVMTNVDIFIAAIQSLKRETEKEGKLKVVPRPEHVRKMEVSRGLDLRPSCVDKKIAIGKRGECLAIPLDGIMQVLSRTAAGSPHYANRISDMYFLVRSPDKSTFQVPVCGFKAVFVSYLDV